MDKDKRPRGMMIIPPGGTEGLIEDKAEIERLDAGQSQNQDLEVGTEQNIGTVATKAEADRSNSPYFVKRAGI